MNLIKQKIYGSLGIIILLFSLFLPTFILAVESKSSADDKTGITYECGDGVTAGNCDFSDLIKAVQKVINKGIAFALFFSVVVIAYAGSKYLTSGDDSKARGDANKMLQSVAWGIFWMLGAWVVVNLITTILLGKDFGTIFTR